MELFNEISYKTSRMVTRTYSSSFSMATSLLDEEIRNAIYSIYGFVRYADEIVDSFHSYDKKHLLEKFEADFYDGVKQGISMNPVLHAFHQTVKKYNISDDHIQAFMNSMKADLHKTTYNDQAEMAEYIYGSADVVGLMCLKVFVNGDERMYAELLKPAMRLGSAFQKVNFLRDLKNDTEQLSRIYFPQLKSLQFTQDEKEEIISNIEDDFREARKGIKELPGSSKLAVYVAYLYYRGLLNKLKRTPAGEIMQTRIRISNGKKVFLLVAAYLTFKLGRI
jgi:15-cis-phytoene synthase